MEARQLSVGFTSRFSILDILRRKSLQNAGEETAFNDDYIENQIFTHVVFKE